jgi:predicted ArsR family transcriptional regulator
MDDHERVLKAISRFHAGASRAALRTALRITEAHLNRHLNALETAGLVERCEVSAGPRRLVVGFRLAGKGSSPGPTAAGLPDLQTAVLGTEPEAGDLADVERYVPREDPPE